MANIGTRRNKNKNKENMEGGKNKNKNKSEGGRRKTRKVSKGASDWNKKVMEIYHKMKKENPDTKLGDAMRRASALKKKGQL